MWYVFYDQNDKQEPVVRGIVQVVEVEWEANVAEFPMHTPEDMLEYVEGRFGGMEFGALDDCPDSEDGFDSGRIDHWKALGNMGNNGYSWVDELTDEEFDKWVGDGETPLDEEESDEAD